MPCERPVLLMLLSDGGLLAYQAFASPVGLRFARMQLDWIGHSEGRGAHGISSRMTRFEGLGEGKLIYRQALATFASCTVLWNQLCSRRLSNAACQMQRRFHRGRLGAVADRLERNARPTSYGCWQPGDGHDTIQQPQLSSGECAQAAVASTTLQLAS